MPEERAVMDFLRIVAIVILTTALGFILLFAIASMILVLQGSAP